jgi:hypothetical protein
LTEDRLQRIERKIDLLFRFLLKLKVKEIGYPYDYDYLKNFSNDLITLFDIKIPTIESETIHEKLCPKLNSDYEKAEQGYLKLKSTYEEKNYLAKEENSIKLDLTLAKEKYDKAAELLSNAGKIEGVIKELNQFCDSILIYIKLHEKLEISSDLIQRFGWIGFHINNVLGEQLQKITMSFEEFITLLTSYNFNELVKKINQVINFLQDEKDDS